MTHGSLFSGIGGFDLAAEWMGWQNIFHCEWNPFGQRVLKHYWPNAKSYEDICATDFTIHRGQVDIITGGFPCQPYSLAGKRKGKEDERHLWPQMLRTIREVAPSWVVGENVFGLVNWNGGLVFHEVQSDLEAEGYEVFPFLLPACSVNAPHRRDRIWFVAHALCNGIGESGNRRQSELTNENGKERGIVADTYDKSEQQKTIGRGWENSEQKSDNWNEIRNDTRSVIVGGNVTNTKSLRPKKALEIGELERKRFRQSNQRNIWDSFPSVSPICDGDDGLPERLDGITFPKWRNESIKAGGNAIVPQVAYQIFKTIEQYERVRTAKAN